MKDNIFVLPITKKRK